MSVKKAVRCIETGEVFESMTAAGKSIGSSGYRSNKDGGSLWHSHISHAIHKYGDGRINRRYRVASRSNRTAGGFHWEFVGESNKETKKCDGIYGHYYCVEDGQYEEPVLPLHEFHNDVTQGDGLQHICKWCKAENHKRRDYTRKNSITSLAARKAGGFKALYALPRDERLKLRSEAAKEVGPSEPRKISTLYLEEALPKIYKTIKRKPPKQEKEDYPPEGYVYVFRNRWHPEGVYKIGSTDNLEGRRSAARTWGAYNCEYYLEVDDCKLVESMVHTELKDCRVEAEDLGQEHFNVELEEATSVIKDLAFEVACMHKDCAA